MFRNLLSVSLRNFIRQKGYSVINVTGLVIGLTATILILIYVIFEFGFDRFHHDPEDVYRVVTEINLSGKEQRFALSITPMAPELRRRFPEVLAYSRINKDWNSVLMANGERKFYEDQLLYADSGFFKIFDFKILSGNPDELLTRPYTMVITRSMAGRYFPGEDPVGKSLKRNNGKDFIITGVLEDPPPNSHLQFSCLLSFSTLYQGTQAKYMDQWSGNINYYTYLRLRKGTNEKSFEDKVNETILEFAGDDFKTYGFSFKAILQPLLSIHLDSNLEFELSPNNSRKYVLIFIAVAVIILIIAAINYMNLSTARSARRAREVGIRKVTGASRRIIIMQFLGESIFYALLSYALSLILIELLLPLYGNMMNRELIFSITGNPSLFLLFLGLSVVVGLISGIYPALYLSGFEPVRVLKGSPERGRSGTVFRNLLVIVQFSISLVLMIGTLVISLQLKYIRDARLGFNDEHVIVVPIRSNEIRKQYRTIVERLDGIEGIEKVAASQNYFSRSFSGDGYKVEGQEDKDLTLMSFIDVDPEFLDLFEMHIVRGRNFSDDYGTESESVILNEAAVSFLGLENPLGTRLLGADSTYFTVIGVVGDFHFTSLHSKIQPLVIHYREHNFNYLNIKLAPGNISSTLARLKSAWKEIDPSRPLDYLFLDSRLDMSYDQDRKLGQIFIYFTFLAIFVALLGLFGLSSYVTEQRTAEIGIRKVLGASVSGVVRRLSFRFILLVLLSSVIAWPPAYFLMRQWLQGFAYNSGIPWWTFPTGTLAALIVAFLTVGAQSLRAALANPAESLRYE